jgi:hypothetical protein
MAAAITVWACFFHRGRCRTTMRRPAEVRPVPGEQPPVQHGLGNAKFGDRDGDTGAVNHLGGGRKSENNGEQYQRHDGRERHNNPIAAGREEPMRGSQARCVPRPKGARHYGRCQRHPRPLAMQRLSGPAAPGAAKRLYRGLAATASGMSSTPASATTLCSSTNLGFALLSDARAQLLFRLSSPTASRMRQPARKEERGSRQADHKPGMGTLPWATSGDQKLAVDTRGHRRPGPECISHAALSHVALPELPR